MLHETIETTFEEEGSLEKPAIYGRLVRLAIGVWLLLLSFPLVTDFGYLIENGIPLYGANLVAIGVIFWVLPYVVNIGWSINSKRAPQLVVIAASLVLGGIGFARTGSFYGPALQVFTLLWFFYATIHLGLSMVLAALIATPGCEMRAIPQIWARATGRETREHFCPGFLNGLDRWERGRDSASEMQK